MARVNARLLAAAPTLMPTSPRLYGDLVSFGHNTRTHEGGLGVSFSPFDELRRAVVCCLLGERQFYEDGIALQDRIASLVAQVTPEQTIEVMQEARVRHGLRHAPLLVAVEAARRKECRPLLRAGLASVLRTPRDAMDLIALYWTRQGKDQALPHAFKAAIRDGFGRWTEYQIGKYATLKTNVSVRLRDLLFLARAKPAALVDRKLGIVCEMPEARAALFKALADDTIRAPDTWEAALSAAGKEGDKALIWTRLLAERKLSALALVRNLRNMISAGVPPEEIQEGLRACRAEDIWPWQALAAAREAPALAGELSALMVRACGRMPRLPGRTCVLVDVSGSMDAPLSQKGTMKRMDAGFGVAVVAREVCDSALMATFSNSLAVLQEDARGMALAQALAASQPYGGTNLTGAVAALLTVLKEPLDRLIILTDEQAHGGPVMLDARLGRVTIVNLASYQNGVRHDGPIDRIDGWSANVLRYIAEREGIVAPPTEDEDAD